MTRFRRLGLVILILFLCTSCDRVTKNIAQKSLMSSPRISLLYDIIRIEYAENPGAILGLGANLPDQVRFLFSAAFASLVLVMTIIYAVKTHSTSLMPLTGLSLVAAGGLGNFLDRLVNDGMAIDFLNLGIGPLRTGIFNIADVAIVGGVSVFLLFSANDRAKVTAA